MILDTIGIIQERLNLELQKALKDLELNIHCGHIWLLMIVYENNGEIQIKELVKRLEKKKTTISDMIATLEKNGYLTKSKSIEDKRVYIVSLTEKAKKDKETFIMILNNIYRKIFNGISEEELNIANETLKIISDNLK